MRWFFFSFYYCGRVVRDMLNEPTFQLYNNYFARDDLKEAKKTIEKNIIQNSRVNGEKHLI